MTDAALAEALRELALRVRTLSQEMWLRPERFLEERSSIARRLEALADRAEPQGYRRLKVEVERGRGRRVTQTLIINGRTVTVQQRRASFAICVEKSR